MNPQRSMEEKGEEMRAYINSLTRSLISTHPLWKDASDNEITSILESLEKFLTWKLYPM